MKVIVRKFAFDDIPLKVRWINNDANNKYLHYDLPLEKEKTEAWFEKNKNNTNRYDAIIEVDGEPVGLIGLLNINPEKQDAEYYIVVGETKFRGNNIALKATGLLFKLGFEKLHLNKIYLTTETGNIPMQKLANKLGMVKESLLMDYAIRDGEVRDVYFYSIFRNDFIKKIHYPAKTLSDIQSLGKDKHRNSIFIKRDDLIPFSFGGNKARKAKKYFDDILRNNYNVVVTYGSKVSNHCRVISNLCAKYDIKCIIISPYGDESNNHNRALIKLSGAKIIECSISEVSGTIDNILEQESKIACQKVYFIPGGGHSNLGTQAYIDAYHEIKLWSRRHHTEFDFIFLASGTGTTQAGLVIGSELHIDSTQIVGISIARDEDYGKEVIINSIDDYTEANKMPLSIDYSKVIFTDKYINRNYGETSEEIDNKIIEFYNNHGIQLNSIYTGKAFSGMEHYIESNGIKGSKILFMHTGGNPLFLDDLKRLNDKGV
ncbi:pyridoxal-phosphate dependent enzyme [Aerococcus urinaeequi]|uniref:pyridoxal-phosphate dependent enzyme n=1 Tax=Aerococcus urinaeequi TaxID=51665 RepID=UPI003D6A4451